jgi:hypothetical protein
MFDRIVLKGRELLHRKACHVFLIALVGLLAYSNTFNSPFMWDEKDFIVNNPIVKDLDFFVHPSKAEGLELYDALKRRYVGFFTFALNYRLHGFDVRGYHAFNLAVHISNALLVYLLLVLTFRTPFMKESALKEHSKYIALFSALLFVAHPVQTEAVTYVFQRLASLVAFFYLLSLVLYIKWRLRKDAGQAGMTKCETPSGEKYLSFPLVGNLSLYLVSLLSAVLAMKTKENAFTLPVMISLYEFFFFEGPFKRRMFRLSPLLLTMAIIPLTLADFDPGAIGPAMSGYTDISRQDYLFTQFRVIVTYIRLLFVPVNQNIGYDYPLFHSLFTPEVLASAVFLSAIFISAIYAAHRAKRGRAEVRLIGFGVLWFFLTLSVESSIIPIPMVINEYRLYLPSIGISGALTTGLFMLAGKRESTTFRRLVFPVMCVTVIVLSVTAYSRNNVWRSKISLWEDTVKKSPMNASGHINLGNAYKKQELFYKAINEYFTAIKLKPNDAEPYFNLGNLYFNKGFFDKAINNYLTAVELKPDYVQAYNNLGLAYYNKGFTELAIKNYQKALELNPDDEVARSNLKKIYLETSTIGGQFLN